jgi:hypothetical protein
MKNYSVNKREMEKHVAHMGEKKNDTSFWWGKIVVSLRWPIAICVGVS